MVSPRFFQFPHIDFQPLFFKAGLFGKSSSGLLGIRLDEQEDLMIPRSVPGSLIIARELSYNPPNIFIAQFRVFPQCNPWISTAIAECDAINVPLPFLVAH